MEARLVTMLILIQTPQKLQSALIITLLRPVEMQDEWQYIHTRIYSLQNQTVKTHQLPMVELIPLPDTQLIL